MANELTDHLLVSDLLPPMIPETPEALRMYCWPFGDRNLRVIGDWGGR